MNENPYPILEFDPTPDAVISPSMIGAMDVPEHAAFCFFAEVVEKVCAEKGACVVHPLRSARDVHPL